MSGQIVPAKDPPAPAQIVAAVDSALALWDADLAKTSSADLRGMIARAIEAGKSGQIDTLAFHITNPATRREISKGVAEMLKTFQKRADSEDLETFTLKLCQDIHSIRPSAPGPVMAFTILRRQSTFRPEIAEVYEAVKSQAALCDTRAALLRRLGGRVLEAGQLLKERGDGAAG